MKEHIDRCFASVNGHILFPHAIVQHISTLVSDHNANYLFLEGFLRQGPRFGKRFHFKSVWLGEDECEKIFAKKWNSFDHTSVATKDIVSGMSRCASKLLSWNKYSFSYIKLRLKECYQLLADIQSKSPSVEHVRHLNQVENEIDCLLYKEESRWKQRSRLSWLHEGDRNTRYFHNHASARFRKNYISGITTENGHWITNPQTITSSFLLYYQKLFTSTGSRIGGNLSYGVQGRVTSSMSSILCQPFTAEEIKLSLFQMPPSKAPRFDGLPACFYQHYWHLVGDKLTAASLRVLNDGDDMRDINHMLIALVPKVNKPLQVIDFRPISLCNVIYKIISKTIVNRLKTFLPDIILEEQSAFVLGHQITDNILLVFEYMHTIERKKSGSEGLMLLNWI